VPHVEGIVKALRTSVQGVQAEPLSSQEAARLVRAFSEGERLCQAGRTLAARAVEPSGCGPRRASGVPLSG